MSEREAFMEQIRAAPEDDTVRLVYADWLQDHDDPGLARFIRLQVELAQIPTGNVPGRDANVSLLYEARDLLDGRVTDDHKWWPFRLGTSAWFKVRAQGTAECLVEYEAQNLGPNGFTQMLVFRRGFVDRAYLNATDLVGALCSSCLGNGYLQTFLRNPKTNRRERVVCNRCLGAKRLGGCAEYLFEHPLTSLAVWDVGAMVEFEPPGPDYGWQAYGYRIGATALPTNADRDYAWMIGGNLTHAEMVDEFLKRVRGGTLTLGG